MPPACHSRSSLDNDPLIIAEGPSFRGNEVWLVRIGLPAPLGALWWHIGHDGLDGRAFEQGLEILSGRGSRLLHDPLRRSFSNDVPPVDSAARPQILTIKSSPISKSKGVCSLWASLGSKPLRQTKSPDVCFLPIPAGCLLQTRDSPVYNQQALITARLL